MEKLKRPKRILHHEVSNLKFLLYVDELEAYVDKLEKAIDYIPCCETLKDKVAPTFEEWKEQNKITISKCGKKLADNEGYVFEEWELIDKYNYEVMNL